MMPLKTSRNAGLFKPDKNSYEMELVFKPNDAALFGVDLLVGKGRKLRLSYNQNTSILTILSIVQ